MKFWVRIRKKAKPFLLMLFAVFVHTQAHAWGVTAVGDDNVSRTSFNYGTPEEASESALKECEAATNNCKLSGEPVRQTALVLAIGTDGWGSAANPDPKIAASKAMSGCKSVTDHCHISTAAWDTGATWGAIAMSHDTFFISTDNHTQKSAWADAMSQCEKNSGKDAHCSIWVDGVHNKHVYYTSATSATKAGFGVSETREGAKASALDACNKWKLQGETCSIQKTYENRGPTAEPASMKQLTDEIARSQELKKTRTALANTSSRQVVTCTNQCFNGSCVRTFANGRKERWQAPRVYDPVAENWTWDITSNACGM